MRNYIQTFLGHVDWIDGGMNPRTTYRMATIPEFDEDTGEEGLDSVLQALVDQLEGNGFTVTGTAVDGPRFFLMNKDRVFEVLSTWLNLTNDLVWLGDAFSDTESPIVTQNWPSSDGGYNKPAVPFRTGILTDLANQLALVYSTLYEATNGPASRPPLPDILRVLKKVLTKTVTQGDLDTLFAELKRYGI